MAVNAGPALSVRMRADVNSNVLIETKSRHCPSEHYSRLNRYSKTAPTMPKDIRAFNGIDPSRQLSLKHVISNVPITLGSYDLFASCALPQDHLFQNERLCTMYTVRL